MDEQAAEKGMSSGKVVAIAIVVAIVCGGGAYAYVNNKAEKEKKDLNAKITELQSQISSATVDNSTATTPDSSKSTTEVTDDTADWTTYTNTSYGYSFKYPETWVVGDSPAATTPDPASADVALDGPEYASYRFAVRVTQPTACSTLQNCAEKNRATFGTGEETTGLSSTTINGVAALTETITRPTQGEWKYYVNYLYKGGNLFVTHTIAKASDDAATKPTFDKILSTFQFTK